MTLCGMTVTKFFFVGSLYSKYNMDGKQVECVTCPREEQQWYLPLNAERTL